MNKTAKIIISILILYIISLLSFSGCNNTPKVIEIEKVDTIQICDTAYITKSDTFIKTSYIPIKEKVIEYVEIEKDTVLPYFSKQYNDTICTKENDSIIAEIFTSGLEHQIDSTKVSLRKQEKIITNTIEITKLVEKKKRFLDRFHIAPNASLGYGLFQRKLDFFFGVGINFDL